MKKAAAIILTVAVVLGLNACGVVVREADFRGNTTGLNVALNKVEDTTEKIVMKPSAVPESERTDDAFIPENHFPEDDLIVCIEDVTDHGAKADGVTDDSDAVIEAINSAASKGGGCVYIPSGKYKITKNITVPAGVTLCGDWKSPEETPAGSEGTVILAYVPASYDRELFNMVSDAGLRNLTVFYPEMTADNAASYKPTVKHSNGDCMMLENITIVNSNDAIAIGRDGGSELHTLKNVYISCLGTGIFIDQVYDIGRLEGIYISPKYWQENVLKPLNGSEKKAVEDKIFETAAGLQINRSDWEYTYAS